jgi:mannosyltransferase OCH1-like enzyme
MIPRHIHFVWLGKQPMHSRMEGWLQSWSRLNSDWDVYLWHDETGAASVVSVRLSGPDRTNGVCSSHFTSRYPELLRQACHLSQRSNIWRYELVREFGGLYVDTDVEPFKPIGDLIAPYSAFTCSSQRAPGVLECAFLGATRGHPWVVELCDRLPEQDPTVSGSMGVSYFTKITALHREGSQSVTVLPTETVDFEYPNPWAHAFDLSKNKPVTDELYARHHVSSQWYPTGFQPC